MNNFNNKNIIYKILIIIFLILFLSGTWIISTYNDLVIQKENVSEKYAYVQTAYERRADLIPNLVEITKGYTKHENDVFIQVAKARSKLINAQNPEELTQADNFLSQTLKSLFAVTENYPELKANENFLKLQDELAGTENRIKTERDLYNSAVKEYNIQIKTFPTILIAKILGFKEKEMFKASYEGNEKVKISF